MTRSIPRNPLLAAPQRAKGGARSPTLLSPEGLAALAHAANVPGTTLAAIAKALGINSSATFARILKRQPEAAAALDAVPVAKAAPTPSKPPSGPLVVDGAVTEAGRGFVQALATEGRPRNFIASRIGLTRKLFAKAMDSDTALRLCWEFGQSSYEADTIRKLEEHGKTYAPALMFLAKCKLGFRENDSTNQSAPTTNVTITLPAAERSEADYLKFIEANPLQPQAALPPPFEDAVIVDDNDDSPDAVYVKPSPQQRATTLDERDALKAAKAEERDRETRARIHEREGIALKERQAATKQQMENRIAQIQKAKATLARMTPEERATEIAGMSPQTLHTLGIERPREITR